jgi:hypothetical protein
MFRVSSHTDSPCEWAALVPFPHNSSSLVKLVEVREAVEENFEFLRSWVSIA